MDYLEILKSNQGKNLNIIFRDGSKIISKIHIVNKINPDDVEIFHPEYIEIIEDENNNEIFLEDIESIEILN